MCPPQSEQQLFVGFLPPNRFPITNSAHTRRHTQNQHVSWRAYQDHPFHPQQWESTCRTTLIGLTCTHHNQNNSCLQVSCLPTGSRSLILPIRDDSHKINMSHDVRTKITHSIPNNEMWTHNSTTSENGTSEQGEHRLHFFVQSHSDSTILRQGSNSTYHNQPFVQLPLPQGLALTPGWLFGRHQLKEIFVLGRRFCAK